MVRKLLWPVMAFVVLVFPACRAAAETLEDLYKAAKKDGEVVIWAAADPWEVQMLGEEFNKKFPGIKVSHFEIREDDYVPRVLAEARQGVVNLDVSAGRLTAVSPLLERDLIQSYNNWTALFQDLNTIAVSKDGRALTWYSLVPLTAYNTRLVKPEEVPRSWDELLLSKWKGRIIVEPRAMAFAYLGLAWGEEKMVEYLKKLRAQDPIFVKGGTGVAQQLIAGAAPLSVGAYIHKILQMQKEGADVDWAKQMSPVAAASLSLYVMRGASHPNAGKLFAGWLASGAGQGLLNERLFRGALNPGSSYVAMREIERNDVEVMRETIENYKKAAALNKVAVRALGVLR